jgi:nucleoside-diphosphate-sugar epimerase
MSPREKKRTRKSLHVDAAASAALLAVEKARRGIFNIAEPNDYLSTTRMSAQQQSCSRLAAFCHR